MGDRSKNMKIKQCGQCNEEAELHEHCYEVEGKKYFGKICKECFKEYGTW